MNGCHLSPISGEGGLQPIVYDQPAGSGEGRFLAVSPGLFSDSVVRYFAYRFWSWLSWLCDQGIVQGRDCLLHSRLATRNSKDHNNVIFFLIKSNQNYHDVTKYYDYKMFAITNSSE